MNYIFTAEQLAGIIQYNLKTDDPLVFENVAFIAELAYQDSKDDMRKHTDQPWPERLADTHFEAYNYGAFEMAIRTSIDELPHDFKLTTITVGQIMIIKQFLENILEQCNERTVFEIVDYVANCDEVRSAYDSESKEIIIDIK